MLDDDLYSKYEDAIGELLEVADNSNRDWLVQSLKVPENLKVVVFPDGKEHRLRIPDESPEIEIAQAFVVLQAYEKIVKSEKSDICIRAHLALMLSINLLEADIWHTILGNLLRTINGVRPTSRLFRGQCLEHKLKMMTGFLAESTTGILSINRVYQTLCNQDVVDLRNAFFHSQYLLVPNKGDVVFTKWFTKQRPAGKKGEFKFSEIQDIFRRITTFLTVLARIRREILKSTPQKNVNK